MSDFLDERGESSTVVDRLSSLLDQSPTQFEITILPLTSRTAIVSGEGPLPLDQSLCLAEGGYLGLDARSLPWMTRAIRREYKEWKLKHSNIGGSGSPESASLLVLFRTLSCLLLVNPDHATAWADRRRCIHGLVESSTEGISWIKELEFINLLMTQHSKAPFSWAHRKYVLKRIERKDAEQVTSSFDKEKELCRQVAERYPKNYYAWTHRMHCLNDLHCFKSVPMEIKLNRLKSEWEDILLKWMPLHVSDHSAVHYSTYVLGLWLSITKIEDVVHGVLEQVRTLIEKHEPHETLWILRRIVIRMLLESDHASARELAMEDAMRVATANFVDTTSGEGSSDDNVHALTYLAWVEQFFKIPPSLVSRDRLVRELVTNDNIHHQMWAE